MKFNELKCKVMCFGHNNPKHTYVLGNTELAKVTNERDLGIYITEDVKPSLQCVEAAKKASLALGVIKRTFTYYNCRSFATLYKTYIRPHMEFQFRHGIHISKKILNAWKRFSIEQQSLFQS